MKGRLEIALKEANEESVSLKSMSPDALESFMTVVSSLKSIVMSVSKNNNLTFSIIEGSAACAAEAPISILDEAYEKIEIATRGESDDEDITTNLRKIQEEVKRINFDYRFLYKKSQIDVRNIHTSLKTANRISLKRNRKEFLYKLKLINGFLNQIGGKNPNYHFDNGEEKITIECTKLEAQKVNKFLYSKVQSLLLNKEWLDTSKKNEYTHIAVITDSDIINELKSYLNAYNKEGNLIKKLSLTHDFADRTFNQSNNGQKVLKYLLLGFNNKNFHLSELKTLLVISKPFKDNEIIKDERKALLETYQKKRINA